MCCNKYGYCQIWIGQTYYEGISQSRSVFNIIGKGTNKKEYNIAVSYRRKYLDEIVAKIKKHNTKIVAGYFNGKIDEYQDIARKAKMYWHTIQ